MSNNTSVPVKLFSFDLPSQQLENTETKPSQTFALSRTLKHKLAKNATHTSIAAPKRARDKEEVSEDLVIDTCLKKSPSKKSIKPAPSTSKLSKPRPQSAYLSMNKSESQLYQDILNRKIEANTIQPIPNRDFRKSLTGKISENLKDMVFKTEVVIPTSTASIGHRPGISQSINRTKSNLNTIGSAMHQIIKPLSLLEPKSLSSSIL